MAKEKAEVKTFKAQITEPNSAARLPDESMNTSQGAIEQEDDDFDPMSIEERKSQSLTQKIENLIPRFILEATNKDFKKQWRWPRTDPETGLYYEKAPSKSKYQTNHRTKFNHRENGK